MSREDISARAFARFTEEREAIEQRRQQKISQAAQTNAQA
jgi:hypothetical protein